MEIQPNRGIGSKIDPNGSYDGCLGMMQRNESDITLILAEYPLDIVNVSQGNIITDAVTQFISVYYSTDETFVAQMLSSFQSFTLDLWITILTSVVTVYLVIKFRAKLTGKSDYYFYKVTTHLARIGRLDDFALFEKILFISLSVPSLVVVHYFNMLIKTELVMVKQPNIYKSYDDLLKNDVTLIFYNGLGHERPFKGASPGDIRRTLWERSVSRYAEEQIVTSLYIPLELMVQNAVGLVTRKKAIVTSSLTSSLFRTSACKIKSDKVTADSYFKVMQMNRSVETGFFHIGQDERANRVQRGFILSKFFTGPQSLIIKKRLKSFFESGVLHQSLYEGTHLDASRLAGAIPPKDPKSMEEARFCIEGIKKQPKKTFAPPNFANFRSLGDLIIFLLLVSATTAYFEYIYHLCKGKPLDQSRSQSHHSREESIYSHLENLGVRSIASTRVKSQ